MVLIQYKSMDDLVPFHTRIVHWIVPFKRNDQEQERHET